MIPSTIEEDNHAQPEIHNIPMIPILYFPSIVGSLSPCLQSILTWRKTRQALFDINGQILEMSLENQAERWRMQGGGILYF